MLQIRFARRVALKVRADKTDEFLSKMKTEVYPQLRREKGLRRVYLVRDPANPNQFFSVTLWNSKSDADAYESLGHYAANRDKVRELLEEDPTVSQSEVEYHSVGRALPPPATARKARVRKTKRRRTKGRR